MVVLSEALCGYCGGCVSVCPTGALTLAETRLVISEACVDCGQCISACPTGALREGEEPTRQLPSRRYDLVVVGAGPAGSVAAREAARLGLSVLLLEKRQEIGSPVRCAEGVPKGALASFVEPNPQWIAAEVNKAQFSVMAEDGEKALSAEGGEGYILERRLFDRALAEEAAKAGAQVLVKTAATALLVDEGKIKGVVASGPLGSMEIEAQVVIGADGVESQVGAWAGLEVTLPPQDTMVCAQYLLAGIDIDPACTYYYLGRDLAPGGYAWVFPKGEGKANVGLGVRADLAVEPALAYLQRFVESRPFLARGSPVTLVLGNVPVALPPPQLVADGLILVGDAARQVDPLTGGGIINAMTAGQLAAQVAAEAIRTGDTSAKALAAYQEEWARGRGRKMARNYRLRRRFDPAREITPDFLRIFILAVGGK